VQYGLDPMARKLRVRYPRAVCHVINGGDRREAIFTGDGDRQIFLVTNFF